MSYRNAARAARWVDSLLLKTSRQLSERPLAVFLCQVFEAAWVIAAIVVFGLLWRTLS